MVTAELSRDTVEEMLEEVFEDVFDGSTPFEDLDPMNQELVAAFNTALLDAEV